MIKIIGFDLDDTLLNSKNEIGDKEAILKAIDNGVKIVFCSGRPLVKQTVDYYKELGLSQDTYYVAYNGVVIYNVGTGNIEYMNNLNNEDVKKIYHIVNQEIAGLNCNVMKEGFSKEGFSKEGFSKEGFSKEGFSKEGFSLYIHYNNTVYTDRHNFFVDLEHQYNHIDVIEREFWLDDSIAHKFMIGADPKDINKLYQLIKDKFTDYTCLISMPCFIEIFKKDADKYQGLVKVAKMYGINENEIMAFGDSMNDYPMIKNAYVGVAMGNSVDKIKEVSDYVTDDNDHYGITKALKKYNVID